MKTLVIMAAGMGSRFGGLKQIEPVGPHGEIIADILELTLLISIKGLILYLLFKS